MQLFVKTLLIILTMNKMTKPFSPAKSLKQLPRSSYQYINNRLHTPVYKVSSTNDIANQYLIKSQEEIRVSKTAQSHRRILRAYSQIGSRTAKTNKNTGTPSQNQNEAEDVEVIEALKHNEVMEALKHKFAMNLGNRDAFQEDFLEKLGLEQKQSELKRRIYEERKLKDKVHLRNCRLLNACEISQRNTKIIKEESTQNLCTELDKEVEQVQQLNAQFVAKICEQQRIVDQLQEVVSRKQVIIDEKTLKIDQIMQKKTAEHKRMASLYKTMLQLKQEKELLTKRNKKLI